MHPIAQSAAVHFRDRWEVQVACTCAWLSVWSHGHRVLEVVPQKIAITLENLNLIGFTAQKPGLKPGRDLHRPVYDGELETFSL